MAGDGDLEVSPQAVAAIQKGLRAAISELRESGDAAGATAPHPPITHEDLVQGRVPLKDGYMAPAKQVR